MNTTASSIFRILNPIQKLHLVQILAVLITSASLLLVIFIATEINGSPNIANDLSFFKKSTFSMRTPSAATTIIIPSSNINQSNNILKNNLSNGSEISDPPTTKLIFKGNLISRYGIPVAQQKICLLESTSAALAVAVIQPSCPVEVSPLSTTTDDAGNFLIEYNLSESNFTGQIDQLTLSVYINVAEQLIQNYTYVITKHFLQPAAITLDFYNKILHSNTTVKTLVNGSVEDYNTLQSIVGAAVTITYYLPMKMARLTMLSNQVGYFEFEVELDYFEVIVAELTVSKQGYRTYVATEDPKLESQNHGIALSDTYKYTFKQSIKLVAL